MFFRFMVVNVSLSLFCVFGSPCFAQLSGKWLLVQRTKSMSVYKKQLKGSSLLAMRGDVILDAPITKVVYLLENISHKVKWVNRLKEMYCLEKVSAQKRVIYSLFTLPWPIASRDFVYEVEFSIDKKHQRIVRRAKSVTHPKAPKVKGVRALMSYSLYHLAPYGNGDKTSLRAEIHGDPKGWVPAWLVNLLQKNWPKKTMENIQNALKQPYVKEHPMAKKFLKEWKKRRKKKDAVRFGNKK